MTTLERPSTISVGGPPAGARWVRTVVAVHGTIPAGPPLPGYPRDDRGRPRPNVWVHVAGRRALDGWNAARNDQRSVCVYEHGGAWHALVLDGWGRHLERLTPDAGASMNDARWHANVAWRALRITARQQPGRWEIA